MSRITHPQFQLGRSKGIAGTEFVDGFAEIDLEGDDVLREALLQHGYTIEDAPSKASKRSGKAKPAKTVKASESKTSTPAKSDSGEGAAADVFEVLDTVRLSAAGRKLLGSSDMTAEVQEIGSQMITVLWEDGKASDITPSLIERVEA